MSNERFPYTPVINGYQHTMRRDEADASPSAVGPLPPYLMQPTPEQNGLDLSAQMYQSPNSSVLQQQHQQQQQHAQHHQHREVGREMADMMADAGFNRSWDIFGGNFKPL